MSNARFLQRICGDRSAAASSDSTRPDLGEIRRVLGLGAEKVTIARFEGEIIGVWVAGAPLTRTQLAALRASGLPVAR